LPRGRGKGGAAGGHGLHRADDLFDGRHLRQVAPGAQLHRPDVIARVPIGAQDDEGRTRPSPASVRRISHSTTSGDSRSMSALADGTSRAVPTTETSVEPFMSSAN